MRPLGPLSGATDVSAWQRRLRRMVGAPRRLKEHSPRGNRYPTARRLNSLARAVGATDYLEIGLHSGITFERVSISRKWGVDPAPRFLADRLPPGWNVQPVTSDKFFATNPDLQFDLIFIDGWHDFSQVTRDLSHSLHAIRDGGLIVIDDVLPGCAEAAMSHSEISSQVDRVPPGWAGDVFRLVYLLSLADPRGSHYCTIDGEGPIQTVVFPSARRLALADPSGAAAALEWDPSWLTDRPMWLNPVPPTRAVLAKIGGE